MRRVRHLTERDPTAKVLVFSTWQDLLVSNFPHFVMEIEMMDSHHTVSFVNSGPMGPLVQDTLLVKVL